MSPKKKDLYHLPCRTDCKHPATAVSRWFHQEKVPSLIEYGEFRLIVATLPHESGLRGRRGYIFEGFLTKPRPKSRGDPVISVLNRVGDERLNREHCGQRTYKDLENFALYVYEELRKRGVFSNDGKLTEESDAISNSAAGSKRKRSVDEDEIGSEREPTQNKKARENTIADSEDDEDNASDISDLTDLDDAKFRDLEGPNYTKRMFESLEAGVRLDIGISSAADGHRFFVNEISREWYVDLISFRAGDPKSRICSALARARCEYIFGKSGDEEETVQKEADLEGGEGDLA